MKQNSKNILLNDLAARLPYGVKVQVNDDGCIMVCRLDVETLEFIEDWDIKPYLRPMSSMTEDEMKTYRTLQDTACSYHYEFGDIVDDYQYFDNYDSLDYLNSIHLDYRGLIPRGLALEAPEGIYKQNE